MTTQLVELGATLLDPGTAAARQELVLEKLARIARLMLRGWVPVLLECSVGELSRTYPSFVEGVRASAALAVLTVVLMLVLLVPTMTWVRLRVPALRRPMEFLCLLPLIIPAIVLVVGLAPVYAWVTYFFGSSSVWLFLAYTVLVLPYAYRAIDAGLSAIDVRTLSEAARGLGASWPRVFWSVITPNLRTALMSASFGCPASA